VKPYAGRLDDSPGTGGGSRTPLLKRHDSLKGLRDALAYCDAVYKSTTDAEFNQVVTFSTREHRKGSTVQLFTVSVTGSNNMALRWKCDSFAMWQAIAA